jgi:hypothetical protein
VDEKRGRDAGDGLSQRSNCLNLALPEENGGLIIVRCDPRKITHLTHLDASKKTPLSERASLQKYTELSTREVFYVSRNVTTPWVTITGPGWTMLGARQTDDDYLIAAMDDDACVPSAAQTPAIALCLTLGYELSLGNERFIRKNAGWQASVTTEDFRLIFEHVTGAFREEALRGAQWLRERYPANREVAVTRVMVENVAFFRGGKRVPPEECRPMLEANLNLLAEPVSTYLIPSLVVNEDSLRIPIVGRVAYGVSFISKRLTVEEAVERKVPAYALSRESVFYAGRGIALMGSSFKRVESLKLERPADFPVGRLSAYGQGVTTQAVVQALSPIFEGGGSVIATQYQRGVQGGPTCRDAWVSEGLPVGEDRLWGESLMQYQTEDTGITPATACADFIEQANALSVLSAMREELGFLENGFTMTLTGEDHQLDPRVTHPSWKTCQDKFELDDRLVPITLGGKAHIPRGLRGLPCMSGAEGLAIGVAGSRLFGARLAHASSSPMTIGGSVWPVLPPPVASLTMGPAEATVPYVEAVQTTYCLDAPGTHAAHQGLTVIGDDVYYLVSTGGSDGIFPRDSGAMGKLRLPMTPSITTGSRTLGFKLGPNRSATLVPHLIVVGCVEIDELGQGPLPPAFVKAAGHLGVSVASPGAGQSINAWLAHLSTVAVAAEEPRLVEEFSDFLPRRASASMRPKTMPESAEQLAALLVSTGGQTQAYPAVSGSSGGAGGWGLGCALVAKRWSSDAADKHFIIEAVERREEPMRPRAQDELIEVVGSWHQVCGLPAFVTKEAGRPYRASQLPLGARVGIPQRWRLKVHSSKILAAELVSIGVPSTLDKIQRLTLFDDPWENGRCDEEHSGASFAHCSQLEGSDDPGRLRLSTHLRMSIFDAPLTPHTAPGELWDLALKRAQSGCVVARETVVAGAAGGPCMPWKALGFGDTTPSWVWRYPEDLREVLSCAPSGNFGLAWRDGRPPLLMIGLREDQTEDGTRSTRVFEVSASVHEEGGFGLKALKGEEVPLMRVPSLWDMPTLLRYYHAAPVGIPEINVIRFPGHDPP